MRLIIDILVAVTLLCVLVGITMHYRSESSMEKRLMRAEAEVQRFQSQIMLQAALESVELTEFGYPKEIDPEWFENLPENPLLDAEKHGTWVEIAGEEERERRNPRQLMAETRDVARFWYNPYTGFVRARVPGDMSDTTATQLYNRVNGTSVHSLLGSR